jgi:hypothetical protein
MSQPCVLVAISQYNSGFRYASDRLKEKKDLQRIAVKEYPFDLRYINNQERDIVRASNEALASVEVSTSRINSC